jgi:hypothetical protein
VHIHASALDALVVIAYMVIGLFLLRQLAARLSERPIGKAIASIVA